MKIDIQLNGTIPVNIPLEDIITEINELPLLERFQLIAIILNNLYTRDIDKLESAHIIIIRQFLKKQNAIFNQKISTEHGHPKTI
jgi:hypothetical protein